MCAKRDLVKWRRKSILPAWFTRQYTVPAFRAHSHSARLSYKVRPVISPSSYPTYFSLNWQRTSTNPNTLRKIALSRRIPLREIARAIILIERLASLLNLYLCDVARALNHCVERKQVRDLTNFACHPWEEFSLSVRK